MSGGSDRIDKLNFELTQSVTASDGSVFGKGDTVEVSFVGKGTPYHGAYTNVFVDLYYAADKSSPSWTRINSTEYPKRFYLPTTYTTRSFVAGLGENAEALKLFITGSVYPTASYATPGLQSNNNPEIRIKFDDIKLKVHTPHSELTQDGLLVWNSPSRYIKADKDGIDIKGGALEVETDWYWDQSATPMTYLADSNNIWFEFFIKKFVNDWKN